MCGKDIKFDVKTITTPAGSLEVKFVNAGSIVELLRKADALVLPTLLSRIRARLSSELVPGRLS